MAPHKHHTRIELALPDEVVEHFGWSEHEVPHRVREALVLELVRRHVISQGKAAELLELPLTELHDLMGRFQIPVIDLTPDELYRELTKEVPTGKEV